MKPFYLLPLILISISGCKYKSSYEAKVDCFKWRDEQRELSNKERFFHFSCINDESSKKYLGREYKGSEKYSSSYKFSDYKIIKRFKY